VKITLEIFTLQGIFCLWDSVDKFDRFQVFLRSLVSKNAFSTSFRWGYPCLATLCPPTRLSFSLMTIYARTQEFSLINILLASLLKELQPKISGISLGVERWNWRYTKSTFNIGILDNLFFWNYFLRVEFHANTKLFVGKLSVSCARTGTVHCVQLRSNKQKEATVNWESPITCSAILVSGLTRIGKKTRKICHRKQTIRTNIRQ